MYAPNFICNFSKDEHFADVANIYLNLEGAGNVAAQNIAAPC
jgi:hypothetical protein